MLRRWLIRVPCLLALAFVVGVWVASYFGALVVASYPGGRICWAGFAQGLVQIDEQWNRPAPTDFVRFNFYHHQTAEDLYFDPTTLGFYLGQESGMTDTFALGFPLWLPALLLAGLNWFVWRKTRAKRVGGAFPVEVSAAPSK